MPTIMRSPKSWLTSFTYGVSPQPAHAPLNSNNGRCNCWCGMLVILAAFIPKLGAFFTLVPAPVVGAALCTALGIQIGAALEIIVNAGIEERSYYIVGLPVVLGTLIGFLPQNIVNELPQVFRVFLGNGLTFGILLVLFLEHVLMRRPPAADQGES